ncbi:hypothetical protein Misp01_11740 [Microtetraspora sp. NBRC 13810]|nr:hypothetical protein Misp01_11740 [Microtetraspora sp. NBRC 13810]
MAGTVTEAVFGDAHERGDRPALIDLGAGRMYGYRDLADEVWRAASGLVRRGARLGQVAAVRVSSLAVQTVVVHAVIAAGGVAASVPPGTGGEEAARLLTGWDARLLFTTPDLAESAVAAAEGSRVRQVICRGPARDTLDFGELLALDPTPLPVLDPAAPALLSADGARLTHHDLLGRIREVDAVAGLETSDVVLVAVPAGDGAATTDLVALALMRGALVVAAPGMSGPELAGGVHDFGVTVAALTDGSITRSF